ncbi:hypothetical protein AAFP35_01140 [Gordonia sp. CPCC 206044]|uniref:hypothetical protein n=1 Tax=Gordonia sp. CPCC 206044 TaxID=3140793 RepID=UPI003AF3E0E6
MAPNEIPRSRHLLWLLTGVSAALTALILAPILRGGYLLYRDAVSTPRSFVTDTILGLGGVAARAVPQDWVVAMTSRAVDGGAVVTAITFLALTSAGVGYGRMAAVLVPAAGRTGAVAAAVIAIWNPYVAERLLQGHWSLLVSYATIGWLILAARTVVRGQSGTRWAPLAATACLAGFTPTGSVLAVVVVAVVVGAPLLRDRRPVDLLITCTVMVLGALPWLTATAFGSGSTTTGPDGFEVFGLRAEPGLGTIGTVLGLGGIWNADAVPASRTIWWAAAATVALLVVVVAGALRLWRDRATSDPAVGRLALLAAVVTILLVVSAVGPVASALADVSGVIPGVGLLRDTQKYSALLVPFFSLATAAAVAGLRRWVPAGFALATAVLLIAAPLPDLAWGVGGKIRPITYPDDWAAVTRIIPPDDGDVAVWPVGTVRRYAFTDTVSLDPLPRMVRAPVTDSGELIVDDLVVDRASGRGAEVDHVLTTGGSPGALAELGVGWVVVEDGNPPRDLARDAAVAYRGDDLTLYRIPGTVADRGASAAARATVIGAHVAWAAAALLSLVVAAMTRLRRRAPTEPTRRDHQSPN